MRGSMEMNEPTPARPMNEQEYRDMYAEYCMESGTRMTDRGFVEFKAWRKRVEKLFDNRSDSS